MVAPGTAIRAPHEEPGQPKFSDGQPPSRPTAVSNRRIAIIMLMAAETMLFTTLIGGYMVLRGTEPVWPPLDQPRLPLLVTWINTFVLFMSCVTMARAWRALARSDGRALRFSLAETSVLGTTFLAIQGTEWVRLIAHGLTASTSIYGATFYTLIGLHGLHVLAAVAWLGAIVWRFSGSRFTMKRAAVVDICALYWFYVCALWAVLFPLVYLF